MSYEFSNILIFSPELDSWKYKNMNIPEKTLILYLVLRIL